MLDLGLAFFGRGGGGIPGEFTNESVTDSEEPKISDASSYQLTEYPTSSPAAQSGGSTLLSCAGTGHVPPTFLLDTH